MANILHVKPTCIVYIDNSNLFIESQKHAQELGTSNALLVQDCCCRVDAGKVLRKCEERYNIHHCILYGSEPPNLDTVWSIIRDQGINVKCFPKCLYTNKEKRVDPNMVADATEEIVELKAELGPRRSIIVISGDSDMEPVVLKALKHGWMVECWSYKKSKSKVFRESREMPPDTVKFILLDELYKAFTFRDLHWNYAKYLIPAERSFVLRFATKDWSAKNFVFVRNKVADETRKRFRLPIKACWCDLEPDRTWPIIDDDNATAPATFKDFNTLAVICHAKEQYHENGRVVDVYSFKDLFGEYKLQIANAIAAENYPPCGAPMDYQTYRQTLHPVDVNVDLFDSNDCFYEEEPADQPVEAWNVVAPKTRKDHQLYSEPCKMSFWCKFGSKCTRKHTDQEREYFKLVPEPAKRWNYKTRPCLHALARRCKNKDAAYLCSFAHEVAEARCAICRERGKHWTDECPQRERL